MEDQKARVSKRKSALDRLRLTVAPSLAVLSDWYDVELTYTSNAIEGNTLTRLETAILLEKGLTAASKPLKDHLEALGHKNALEFVRSLAETQESIREVDIRAIHRLILGRLDPDEAGKYSEYARVIKGSPIVLPAPWETPALMMDFGQWLACVQPAPESAFDAHLRLVLIHPFSDGNGRTARLLMNLLLLRAGYPPVVIGPEQRTQYIESLEAAHSNHDRESYDSFMFRRLEASLDDYLVRLL